MGSSRIYLRLLCKAPLILISQAIISQDLLKSGCNLNHVPENCSYSAKTPYSCLVAMRLPSDTYMLGMQDWSSTSWMSPSEWHNGVSHQACSAPLCQLTKPSPQSSSNSTRWRTLLKTTSLRVWISTLDHWL